MQNHNGFTLIEVLIASGIVFTVIATFSPIISTLHTEQKVLSERRKLAYALHDELQQFIWNTNTLLPKEFIQTIDENKEVQFKFQQENGVIKGCAKWNNAKNNNEKLCFYGLPES
ncbi:type II secretion system protein [Oceanobacillus sp. FSL K6-2867]|uniref:type II secretion system protein n=1 Tax=Oceanobacillus sp. FSL K6-2867 TaxID=2954748 RepID=UPI0030DCDD00